VRCDDEHISGVPLVFEVHSTEFTELFSSGDDVAFHVRQTGLYISGIPSLATCTIPMVLNGNGIVRVDQGKVVSGRVIRDRLGLKSRLQKALA
jgi:hypothetical protein